MKTITIQVPDYFDEQHAGLTALMNNKILATTVCCEVHDIHVLIIAGDPHKMDARCVIENIERLSQTIIRKLVENPTQSMPKTTDLN